MSVVASTPETYTGPIDPPRMVRHRRVRRGWIGVGVLLIVLSALGAATLFRAIGPSQEYLAVARNVPVGVQVVSDDLRIVRVNASPGINPVPVREVDQVIGRYAAVPLVAGTLLSLDQLTDQQVPGPGQQLVAIALPEDRLPDTLGTGDAVLLVSTTQNTDTPPATFAATVHDVRDGSGRGDDIVVSLLTNEQDGAQVAALAAAGDITIVVSGGGG